MQEDIADLVHPAIAHGLRLQERLDRGSMPDINVEQAIFKDFLLTETEASRWTDFGGEARRAGSGLGQPGTPNAGRGFPDQFLGIRYALVCWLDEMFTCDSPWGTQWNERKLEVELYGTNDRAWKFWEQAQRAQSRPGSNAFEAFFLCVMLGFRGNLRQDPEKLRTWIANAKHRLGNVEQMDWPYGCELESPTRVSPLRGQEKLRRMVVTAWITLLAAIPVAAFLIVQRIGQ